MKVHCWDCFAVFDLASDMETQAFKDGLIRRRKAGDSDSDWMGLCSEHRVMHTRADDPTASVYFRPPDPIRVIVGDTQKILLCARELREHNVRLGIEEAIHRAVEAFFAPERELNLAFREYLLRRQKAPAA